MGADFDSEPFNVRNHRPGTTTSEHCYPAGASSFGAMDMASDVSEWCLDGYPKEYSALSCQSSTGPGSEENRVIRVGTWGYSANAARFAARYWCPSDHRRDILVFGWPRLSAPLVDRICSANAAPPDMPFPIRLIPTVDCETPDPRPAAPNSTTV